MKDAERKKESERKLLETNTKRSWEKDCESFTRARNNFSWDASEARHEAAHFKHLSDITIDS